MVLGTRVGLTSTLSLPKVMQGLGLNAGFGYLQRFLRQNVAEVSGPGYPCQPLGTTSREYCTAFGGLTNTRLALTASVSGELAVTDKWGLSLSYTHAWRRAANLSNDFPAFETDDHSPIQLADGSAHHWRNINTLDMTVTFFAAGWLGLGASVTNLFQERGPDSAIRPPFRPMDTYFGLNVNLRLDELYLAVNPPSSKADE
jgi:hypothetical protein